MPFVNIYAIFHAAAVKEFLETAKEEFEEKWKNPKRVSLTCVLFVFSVQDFLEKSKKEFEENWNKNPKVSWVNRRRK